MAAMSVASYVIGILVWTTLSDNASPFILDAKNCIALPPCTCSGDYMFCDLQNLTTMPTFRTSNITGRAITLSLTINQLTTIPPYVFRNLTVSSETDIYLHLSHNHLNNIATNAFARIANSITWIYLQNNHFTTIPSELGSLSNLQTLNFQSNPISSMNPNTLRTLGSSLQTLYIDLNYYTTWPMELAFLTSLTSLYVKYLNITHIDDDAFDGFANTLNTLSLEYLQIEDIPDSVCHLRDLRSLTFTHNKNIQVNNNSYRFDIGPMSNRRYDVGLTSDRCRAGFNLCLGTLSVPCDGQLTTVTSVNLNENNLEYMPNVFEKFPSMTTLSINNNNLSSIPCDTMPHDHPLTFLDMDNNRLPVIPSAINKLTDIQQLKLANNQITSISEKDMSNLRSLTTLLLTNNPIQYISPNAFKNNLALARLYLDGTQLRQLPSSIAGLPNLYYLYIVGSSIECSCNMAFLKSYNAFRLGIYGTCHNSTKQIESYLKYDLPTCP